MSLHVRALEEVIQRAVLDYTIQRVRPGRER